jgi:hypothetical protein
MDTQRSPAPSGSRLEVAVADRSFMERLEAVVTAA